MVFKMSGVVSSRFPYYKVYFKHYQMMVEVVTLSQFPYYKVYFKHESHLKPSTNHLFPYYKVYFKPIFKFIFNLSNVYFHTIKSILNNGRWNLRYSRFTWFPYYKVYFKPLNSLVEPPFRNSFPYYKVYFKHYNQ